MESEGKGIRTFLGFERIFWRCTFKLTTMGREVSLEEADPAEFKGGSSDWKGMERSGSYGGEKRLEREDSEAKAWSIMKDLDPWTAWLYSPHTVTVLMAGACLLVYVTFSLANLLLPILPSLILYLFLVVNLTLP